MTTEKKLLSTLKTIEQLLKKPKKLPLGKVVKRLQTLLFVVLGK